MMYFKKKEHHSLAKIILITSAVVLGLLALFAVLYKLRQKCCVGCCEKDADAEEEQNQDFVEIECEDDDPSDDLSLADNV